MVLVSLGLVGLGFSHKRKSAELLTLELLTLEPKTRRLRRVFDDVYLSS